MSTKYLKLLELLSTSSCVNLVTIALTVLKLHRGEGLPPPLPGQRRLEKPGLNRINGCFLLQMGIQLETLSTSGSLEQLRWSFKTRKWLSLITKAPN